MRTVSESHIMPLSPFLAIQCSFGELFPLLEFDVGACDVLFLGKAVNNAHGIFSGASFSRRLRRRVLECSCPLVCLHFVEPDDQEGRRRHSEWSSTRRSHETDCTYVSARSNTGARSYNRTRSHIPRHGQTTCIAFLHARCMNAVFYLLPGIGKILVDSSLYRWMTLARMRKSRNQHKVSPVMPLPPNIPRPGKG